MEEKPEIINGRIGNPGGYNEVVVKGICPFCNHAVTFRQVSCASNNPFTGQTVALRCEGCYATVVFSIDLQKFYPSPRLKGLDNLPQEIKKYYEEGLRCISADSPNGAATLFRKVIHALGIHYKLAKKNDDKDLYGIIKELNKGGHIVQKIESALLGIKDIGNDGAHINENEPDMEQALKLKRLIDTVLTSTVLCDEDLEFVKKKHSENKEI